MIERRDRVISQYFLQDTSNTSAGDRESGLIFPK